MNAPLQLYEEILDAHQKLKYLRYEHWQQYELFTLQWWALLFLAVFSWFIWWKLVNKRQIARYTIYSLFVLIAATGMDAFGISRHLWIYPIRVLYVVPHIIPIDWAFLPVIYMLVYQYYPRWKSFLVANTIMSAVLAFIGEPFSEWFGIYFVYHWKHTWSFILYIIIAVMGRWITETLLSVHQNSSSEFK